MKNKEYAKEWFLIAEKHFHTAKFLFENNHYTDIIGIELQQAIEKLFKSLYAYFGYEILRTHDLLLLYGKLKNILELNEDDLDLLEIATDYYKEIRYPGPKYSIPTKEEIRKILEFTNYLYSEIKKILKIKK